MSVVCFGEALIDFISDGKEPESFTKHAGGAPANVAVAIAKLGGNSAFVGMLGRDMFGDFLLAELQKYGVDTQYCRQTDQAKTALAFVSLDEVGERSFSFYRPPAADLLFAASDFSSAAFSDSAVLHICSNSLTESDIFDTTVAAIKMARSHQCVISFDLNLRENLWANIDDARQRILHIMSSVDVVKVSLQELEFLTDSLNLSQVESEIVCERRVIDHYLELGVSCFLVTDGEQPIKYFTTNFNGELAPPSSKAVDTTGAGDAFIGGFLYQLNSALTQKSLAEIVGDEAALADVVSFGAKCGAYTVTQHGAISALPSLEQVQS